jgi:hypothetical protein
MMGVSVDEYNKLHDCEPMLYSQFCGVFRDICPISWLFETKEDAEWHKEFGCIERTERLELPTWEEFQNVDDICFVCVKTGTTVRVFNWGFNGEIYISDEWGISETFEYSKEGYTLACRKAKELFLGQSNDN